MIQKRNATRKSVGTRDTTYGLDVSAMKKFKKKAFMKKDVPVHRRAVVQIKDFARNPKLNGKKGIVKNFDKNDRRWRVELQDEGYTIAVPVVHLTVVDPHIDFVAKYVEAQAAAEE
jgi:hypothetical protein